MRPRPCLLSEFTPSHLTEPRTEIKGGKGTGCLEAAAPWSSGRLRQGRCQEARAPWVRPCPRSGHRPGRAEPRGALPHPSRDFGGAELTPPCTPASWQQGRGTKTPALPESGWASCRTSGTVEGAGGRGHGPGGTSLAGSEPAPDRPGMGPFTPAASCLPRTAVCHSHGDPGSPGLHPRGLCSAELRAQWCDYWTSLIVQAGGPSGEGGPSREGPQVTRA